MPSPPPSPPSPPPSPPNSMLPISPPRTRPPMPPMIPLIQPDRCCWKGAPCRLGDTAEPGDVGEGDDGRAGAE